jgi:hypothetical protein
MDNLHFEQKYLNLIGCPQDTAYQHKLGRGFTEVKPKNFSFQTIEEPKVKEKFQFSDIPPFCAIY